MCLQGLDGPTTACAAARNACNPASQGLQADRGIRERVHGCKGSHVGVPNLLCEDEAVSGRIFQAHIQRVELVRGAGDFGPAAQGINLNEVLGQRGDLAPLLGACSWLWRAEVEAPLGSVLQLQAAAMLITSKALAIEPWYISIY